MGSATWHYILRVGLTYPHCGPAKFHDRPKMVKSTRDQKNDSRFNSFDFSSISSGKWKSGWVSVVDIFQPPSRSQHVSRDREAFWYINSYYIKADPYLHIGVSYDLRMKQVVMDRCRFLCMRSQLTNINPCGYKDSAHSNLMVTTLHDTRIHDITYQRYKYLIFTNKRGNRVF